MPRLTPVLAKGRNPNNIKRFNNYLELFPYKIPTAPVLKNSVSNRKEKNKVVPCVEELGVLLSCWKTTDFSPNSCTKEIKAFNECHAAFLKTANDPGKVANKLTCDDVNKLLKKFPQPPMKYK